jgi:hypothetical protein
MSPPFPAPSFRVSFRLRAAPRGRELALRRIHVIVREGNAPCARQHLEEIFLHQPLGRKANHLAQNIGVGGLLHQRTQVHHIVGHRSSFRSQVVLQPDPTEKRR